MEDVVKSELPLSGQMKSDPDGPPVVAGSAAAETLQPEANPSTHSKRWLKRQARLAEWEIKKKIKRKDEREKKKKNRSKHANTEFSRNALKRKKMATSECKVGIVIDLSFDEHMKNKQLCKTVKQVSWCYSINRRLPQPVQFHVTSFNGETATLMQKHDGFTNWDVKFHEEAYDQVFEKSSIVYLTSDSPNVLDKLEVDKFYIIGGLVDHNSKKGICYEMALEKNISHARLPIDEFLEMKTRKVLSIVHVFEILALVTGGKSWQEALLTVIPARKNAEAKNALSDENSDSD